MKASVLLCLTFLPYFLLHFLSSLSSLLSSSFASTHPAWDFFNVVMPCCLISNVFFFVFSYDLLFTFFWLGIHQTDYFFKKNIFFGEWVWTNPSWGLLFSDFCLVISNKFIKVLSDTPLISWVFFKTIITIQIKCKFWLVLPFLFRALFEVVWLINSNFRKKQNIFLVIPIKVPPYWISRSSHEKSRALYFSKT